MGHVQAIDAMENRPLGAVNYAPMSDTQREANRIRQLLAEKGVSQHELARRMNITQAQVSRLLNGRSGWTMERWREALRVLGATEDQAGELKRPTEIIKSLENTALDFLDSHTKQRLGNLAKRFHLRHSDGTPDLIAALKIATGMGLDAHEAQFRGVDVNGVTDK